MINSLLQKAKWSPNFIRAFGVFSGLRLLIQNVNFWPRENQTVKSYNVPGYEEKIFLRSTISDHATFRQCLVMLQYDFLALPQATRLMNSYHHILKSGKRPLIIDCGANIGLSCLWFAKAFPEAQILAIEPDDDNFHILQTNTKHLGNRVTAIQGGVWNKTARLEILNPHAGSASFRVKATEPQCAKGVTAFTMDELCNMTGSQEPLIVKLDIEGSQAALFESNTDWVKRAHLITLELDDWLLPWAGTSRNFFKCLSQLPFDYLIHKESIFCFQDFEVDQLPDLASSKS